jgi:hypothetical protein
MSDNSTNEQVESFSAVELIHRLDRGYCRLPLHVSRLEAPPGHERLFIVDNNWPDIKT